MIVDATSEHAVQMAPRVRYENGDDVITGTRRSPLASLEYSLSLSIWAKTWLVDGVPGAMFGLGAPDLLGDKATVWLMATDEVWKHRLGFLRASRRVLQDTRRLYPHLEGYVDSRFKKAVNWAKWLGFEIHDPQPYGRLGMPFHHVELRN